MAERKTDSAPLGMTEYFAKALAAVERQHVRQKSNDGRRDANDWLEWAIAPACSSISAAGTS